MNLPPFHKCAKILNLPGCYVLVLNNTCPQSLAVGRLGTFVFSPGTYAYVGSAMGGLSKRIQRYLKPIRRPHWHIDVLVTAFRLTDVWLFPSPKRQECEVAEVFLKTPHVTFLEGFGCTDCVCPSHLFDITRIEKTPLFRKIKGALDCGSATAVSIPEAP